MTTARWQSRFLSAARDAALIDARRPVSAKRTRPLRASGSLASGQRAVSGRLRLRDAVTDLGLIEDEAWAAGVVAELMAQSPHQ